MALDLDVVSVTKIAATLAQAIENSPVPPSTGSLGVGARRGSRAPSDNRPTPRSTTPRPDWLQVINGGADETEREGLW